MTEKEFVGKISNGKRDILEEFLDILKKNEIPFCIIGGLAVNAYAEPVVSLDLDIVIAIAHFKNLLLELPKEFKVSKEEHSTNISTSFSDLRIQLQTDIRYQDFIARAQQKNVLGYLIPVAAVEDVLQGKLWAYSDQSRRASKRQKDLADIMRLAESNPPVLDTPAGQIAKKIISRV